MKSIISVFLLVIMITGCFQKSSRVEEEASGKKLVITEQKSGKQDRDEARLQQKPVQTRLKQSEKAESQPEPAAELMLTSSEVSGPGKAKAARHGRGRSMPKRSAAYAPSPAMGGSGMGYADYSSALIQHNTEGYDRIYENEFHSVKNDPLSTFSIDVDAASYANVRRFITDNRLPPKDAVRIEELVNYFHYDYPDPGAKDPFSITAEVSRCPWQPEHKLVHIGLQGQKLDVTNLPPSNLVFLLDVSGSMNSPNKLPLLKKAFALLVNQLRDEDRVSIVVYAGAAGVVLPSTSGIKKNTILEALENLQAGGSTAGGAGIRLAYKIALDNFKKHGNNRVILATDGDFNVGASSDGELLRMIEEKRKSGVFLTVLGFGMGNYKDSKMEKLADKGNGNYAYIDNMLEAKKVLVHEIGGTLVTIAKDVKIQVEFNPHRVKAYRLVGYENRMLKAEDFNNDKKDAGELGAGHTVTALYEIVPAGVETDLPRVDDLKYQQARNLTQGHEDELLTVKFRYKAPADSVSRLIVQPLRDTNTKLKQTSDNFRFSAAVAGFGMLLRDSKHKAGLDYDKVLELARSAKGKDREGYRAEFIRLAQTAQLLSAGRN